MATSLFDDPELSESESVRDEREGSQGRERSAHEGSPRRAVVEPARSGAELGRLEGGGGGGVINGGTIEDEDDEEAVAVIGGEGGDDDGKTNPTPQQVQCGQESAPAPTKPLGKGKWSKHCSARLIHAVHDRQSALATIATGKSRSQIDAGENPWDTVAELWNNPEYKPETDRQIRDEIGGRNSPNPAMGLCGARSGPELKKKFAEMKGNMAR